jgi:hypothetical protein
MIDEGKNENNYFFNWNLERKEKVLRGGYHSLIGEAFKAACKQRIGISYNAESDFIEIWSADKEGIVECRKGETTKKIGEILEKRHFERLMGQKCRGQSFKTFKNSPTSNFYVGNCKSPVSDALERFSIRAINDTLWTPAKKVAIFKEQYSSACCGCNNKRFCNLLHILNNCNYNMEYMTYRHNAVQERLVEAITKHRKI